MEKRCFKSLTRWFPGFILLLIALFYFSYLPVNYDFDGTVFSQYLRYSLVKNDLRVTQQPQHPLYIPVNYLLYKSLQKITGYQVLEYFHLQLFSFCFALLVLWLTYKIIKKITAPGQDLFPIAGMFFAAFAYSTWYYSVEAEVHMAGLFFVTAGMYLLFFKPGNPDQLSRTLGACICFTLAAGFHLTNGLIALAVLIIFILEKKPLAKISRFFAVYGFFLLLGLALFVIVSHLNLWDFYKNQLLGKDIQAGYPIRYWTGLSFNTLWGSLKSAAHGIVVPNSPAFSTLSLLFLLCGTAFIIYAGVKHKQPFYYQLGAWMLPYFVFFTFWDHRNLEFKLHVVFPFIILITAAVAYAVGRLQKKTGKLLAYIVFFILILSIWFINFYSYMKPAGRIENNQNYQVAARIGEVTPPGAVIVVAGCGDNLSIHNKIYISYFAGRKVFILDWMLGKGMTLDEIRVRLVQEHTNGTPVYFFSDTLHEGPAVHRLLGNHHLEKERYLHFLAAMDFKNKIPLMDNYYLSRM